MGASPSKEDACNIKGTKNMTIYDIDDGVIDEWTPGAKPLGQLIYRYIVLYPKRVTLIFEKL